MPSRRDVICGVGGLTAAGLAGCTTDDPAADVTPGSDADTEWPQPGGNDRYDCYRTEAAAPREEPSERWTTEVVYPMARPVVADGRVLLTTSGGLYAFDLESGDEVWRLGSADDDSEVRTAPIVVDGTAFVGVAFPHGVVAVDAVDGTREWHVDLERAPTVAPVVGSDREWLAVGTDAGLAGVTTDGRRGWRRETFSPVSALTSWGDEMFVGTEGGELIAFYDLRGPEGMWRRQLDGSVVQVGQLNGDGVVVSVSSGPLVRRDGSSAGAARWEHDSAGTHGFVAARNTYGVGSGLTSVNTRTGERYWSVDGALHAPPAGAGDTIYSGGEGFVVAYAMDGGLGVGDYRTGYERWRHEVAGNVFVGVSVADGAVFATAYGEDGGTLYALE